MMSAGETQITPRVLGHPRAIWNPVLASRLRGAAIRLGCCPTALQPRVAALRERHYNWNRQPIFSDVVSSPALGSVRPPHSARRAWTVSTRAARAAGIIDAKTAAMRM